MRRTVLPGGLRVVTEHVPGVRSAAFGIWVGVGSRDETPAQAGAAHYLEHLLFKGTRRRSALDISASIDAVGGEMNAFTSKEYTCFYARVLDVDLPLAVDVISDLVTSALLRSHDVDGRARRDPRRDRDARRRPRRPRARGVRRRDVRARRRSAARSSARSRPSRPSPRGRSAPSTASATSRRTWSSRPPATSTTPPSSAWCAGRSTRPGCSAATRCPRCTAPGEFRTRGAGDVRVLTKTTEQANVVLGVPGLARDDDRRFALGVLNSALGGGMSSRLFQEIREKRGLAYSVFSFSSHYADTGMFGVYAGCMPKKVDEVLEISRDELVKVAQHGITRRGARPRQGAGARRPRARSRGHRFAHVAHRQGRAARRRPLVDRRGPRRRSTPSPSTTSARSRPGCSR